MPNDERRRYWPAAPPQLVDPRVCPECFLLRTSANCPRCGLVFFGAESEEIIALNRQLLGVE